MSGAVQTARVMIPRSAFNRVTVAAFIRDRAHQFDESSGIFHALLDVAREIENGAIEEAFNHGELDDLLPSGRRSL